MSPAAETSLSVVAYLGLFASVGLLFLFANLLVGWLVRPSNPHAEKLEIYECGEPAIGSSYVQFDLRFYVVALLFIIFDVEVAFFFPWAVVFGKASQMSDSGQLAVVATESEGSAQLTAEASYLYQELGVRQPQAATSVPPSLQSEVTTNSDSASTAEMVARRGSRQLLLLTLFDIGAFFGILMVGFAYVWRRGDLDWVRAVSRAGREASGPRLLRHHESDANEPALSA